MGEGLYYWHNANITVNIGLAWVADWILPPSELLILHEALIQNGDTAARTYRVFLFDAVVPFEAGQISIPSGKGRDILFDPTDGIFRGGVPPRIVNSGGNFSLRISCVEASASFHADTLQTLVEIKSRVDVLNDPLVAVTVS